VHVDPRRGEPVEAIVVRVPAGNGALMPALAHGGYGTEGTDCVVAPVGRLNRLAGGLDE
jgi:hypothetical protein